jgi:hypothetical protein
MDQAAASVGVIHPLRVMLLTVDLAITRDGVVGRDSAMSEL